MTYATLTATVCCTCGVTFRRKTAETWRAECFPCWKQALRDDAYMAGWEAARRGLEALLDAEYRKGFDAARNGAAKVSANDIDRAKIRALLQLCHPDKHAGSGLALTTTQWLLDVKAGL